MSFTVSPMRISSGARPSSDAFSPPITTNRTMQGIKAVCKYPPVRASGRRQIQHAQALTPGNSMNAAVDESTSSSRRTTRRPRSSWEKFPPRNIKTNRLMKHRSSGAIRRRAATAKLWFEQRSLRYLDGFWLARRARGVNHVSEIVRRDGFGWILRWRGLNRPCLLGIIETSTLTPSVF